MDEPMNEVVISSPSDVTPLTGEETANLAKYEADIEDGLADFVRVGQALMQIAQQSLYREGYATFEIYCRQRWGLARRTAYQKMHAAEAYENVRNYAQISPRNEFQALQLHALPTKELQQTAWKQVVDAQKNDPRAITAQKIRHVVTTLQPPPQRGTTLSAQLVADRTFPGISWQWPVAYYRVDPETKKRKRRWLSLPTPVADTGDMVTFTGEPRLILVNREADIFEVNPELPSSSFTLFIKSISSSIHDHFLLWTDHLHRYPSISWPMNVEIGARIRCQADINRLMALDLNAVPIRMLWLIPDEPLTLPSPCPFTRILLGSATWLHEHSTEDHLMLRHLLGTLLMEPVIIHLATPLSRVLYTLPVGSESDAMRAPED